MSIPFKTEHGRAYLAMAINCNETTAKIADDGDCYEYIKCIAKTVKPLCARCSLANPYNLPPDPTKSSKHD